MAVSRLEEEQGAWGLLWGAEGGSEDDCRTARRPHPIFGVLYEMDGTGERAVKAVSNKARRPPPRHLCSYLSLRNPILIIIFLGPRLSPSTLSPLPFSSLLLTDTPRPLREPYNGPTESAQRRAGATMETLPYVHAMTPAWALHRA